MKVRVALFSAGAFMLTLIICMWILDPPDPTRAHIFWHSDTPYMAGAGLFLILASYAPWPTLGLPKLRLSPAVAALIALVVAGALSVLMTGGFDLVRDELDADFDAAIFRTGHLLTPVAPEWRALVHGLRETQFITPVPGDVMWSSAYLPINAAIRALAGATIGVEWANPLLLSLAVFASVATARRLWPERNDAALLAAVLLLTSVQAVAHAATAFSMTGHLALNAVWLWLFVRNARWSHVLAVVVGFFACGLHQVVFHPLFVGPFITALFFQRRYGLFAWYVAAYAVVCLFWIQYPALALTWEGVPREAAAGAGAAFFLTKVLNLFAAIDPLNILLMIGNAVRFLTWQNPLALPLIALAWPAVRRGDAIAAPMAAGLVIAPVMFYFIMPYQGLGWGYRYLNGFLGSWCVLAVYGWVEVTAAADAVQRRALGTLAAAVIGVTALVIAPLRLMEMRAFQQPFRNIVALVRSAPTDIVVVDYMTARFGSDITRNDPFLRAKPKMIDLIHVDMDALAEKCRSQSVALVRRETVLEAGFVYRPVGEHWEVKRNAQMARLAQLPCSAPIVELKPAAGASGRAAD